MNDAGVDCKSIDWSAVNAAHDKYLDQVLADRIIARVRIDQLFRPVDLPSIDLQKEISPTENLRITKSALGINRDFAVQLAGQDALFLRALADAGGLNHSITGYLLARRNMQRTARLFQIASIPNSLTTQFPIPAYMVLAAWPKDVPRSTEEIIAWTTRISPQLSSAADEWWSLTSSAVPAILQAGIYPRDAAESLEIQKVQSEKKIAQINAKTRAAAVNYLRAVFAVLDQDAPGIPAVARESARDQTLALMTQIAEIAPTLRALKVAEDSEQLSSAIRERVKKIHLDWFAAQAVILRNYLEDHSPQVKAAALAYEKLQSLIPKDSAYESLREQIKIAYKKTPEAVAEPVIESEEVSFYSSAQEYKNWINIGVISAAPSRESLQALARIAQFNSQQENLFVNDARNEWHQLLEDANKIIKAGQDRFSLGSNALTNPETLDKLIKAFLKDCVFMTNQHANELDERIAKNLASQAAVLGGRAEPAATIWRVLRTYPARPFAVVGSFDLSFNLKELRCFQSLAPGSIAVLAMESDLSTATRQVLIDLLVANSNELIANAQATDVARLTAADRILRALAMHQDPVRAKTLAANAIRDFQIVNEQWRKLEESLVNQAFAILPANEAHVLRYRRAQLLVPEIFYGGSTPFALDRLQSLTRAGALLGTNDRALGLALEMDDLALLDSINKKLALTPTAQPSNEDLSALYKSDEALAEQSMKRIDRATRAQFAAENQRP